MNPNEVVDKSVSQFEKSLAQVIKDLQSRVTAQLSRLKTDDLGNLILNDFNLNYVTSMYNKLEEAVKDAGYLDAIDALQNKDQLLINTIVQNANIPISFTETSKDVITALRDAQMAAFTDIGTDAMHAVRKDVMRSVLTGIPLKDTISNITEHLDTKFANYAKTYALTTRQEVMQATHDIGAEGTEPDDRYWIYMGPQDKITRPACLELLEIGYFNNKERTHWEAKYQTARAYNCRHVFMQVSKDDYDTAISAESKPYKQKKVAQPKN